MKTFIFALLLVAASGCQVLHDIYIGPTWEQRIAACIADGYSEQDAPLCADLRIARAQAWVKR